MKAKQQNMAFVLQDSAKPIFEKPGTKRCHFSWPQMRLPAPSHQSALTDKAPSMDKKLTKCFLLLPHQISTQSSQHQIRKANKGSDLIFCCMGLTMACIQCQNLFGKENLYVIK